MYCDHFRLSTLPFADTPDPRFYFAAPDHEDALAALAQLVQQRRGFALITGDPGAGKTYLGHLLRARGPQAARISFLAAHDRSGPELLHAICAAFELHLDDAFL